jgi:large subunit ribosomal protein L23
MEVLIRPVISEKTTTLSEDLNQYAFVVAKDAEKGQIKRAVESRYGVKVVRVNTSVMPGKKKSRYTRSGVVSGSTGSYKKALVTVAEGEMIDFYSNI